MKDDCSVPVLSVGSGLLLGTDAIDKVWSPPSVSVNFLCLMIILFLSRLGEGSTVAMEESTGAISSKSDRTHYMFRNKHLYSCHHIMAGTQH